MQLYLLFPAKRAFKNGIVLSWIHWWVWSCCKWIIDYKGLDTSGVLMCGPLHFDPAGLLLFEALGNFLSQHYMVLNVCFALKWKEIWKCMLLFSSFNLCSEVSPLRPLIICLCLNSPQFNSIFMVLNCLQMNEELYCFISFFSLIRMLVKACGHKRQIVV